MILRPLKKKFPQSLSKFWPFLIIVLFVGIFFHKVFINKLVPIPGDFIVGTYFPWLDYKWGYLVGVPVKNPVTSDVVSIIYPLRSYVVDMLREGHLPLWNPFMFVGSPLLADFQIAIFSPTILFYFILPKIWAWTAQIVAQPILAASFMYLLLRNFGLRKLESIFGGIFYAFAAFNIIWMEWNANTLTAAFIPLLILFLDKFIKSGKLGWGILLSVGISLQIFSGYPQVVIFTVLALVIFTLFHLKELTKMILLRLMFFMCIGLLLSSVITIPGLEHILNSQRENSLLSADLIYLPWKNLVTFLSPDFFGNPATYNYFGVGNYAINAGYSGVIVLILALIGVLKFWKRKEVKYFVLLFLLALLLALPTPLAKALFYSPIPGISESSNTRVLVLANLSIAVLAGFGVSSFLKKERIHNFLVLSSPLIILFGIAIYTYFYGVEKSISLRNLVLPILFAGLSIVVVFLREKFYKVKSLRILLVLTICILGVIELFRFGWKYTPFSSPDLIFPKTPVFTFFEDKNKPFRVSPGDVVPMNMLLPYDIETTSGYDAAYPVWWARLYNTISNQSTQKTSYSYYAAFEKYEDRWFDLLNNEYLLALNPEGAPDNSSDKTLYKKISGLKKFDKVFQDKSVVIFKNNKSMPRAFFVSDWEKSKEEESLTLLIDPNFPIEKKIVIYEDTDLQKSETVNSKVNYDLYSSEKSIISVVTDSDGFLFISDEWYPGWVATVDGKKTQIYKADYAFRAIPVHKGIHIVEFHYEPKSFKVGLIVSGATMSLLIVIWFYKKRLYNNKK